MISHEVAQQVFWKTGEYNLLISEFTENVFCEMTNKPLINIGVFSLTDVISHSSDSPYFESWSVGLLKADSTLTELIDALAPWLKQINHSSDTANNGDYQALQEGDSEDLDELIITEVAEVYAENSSHAGKEAVFNFSHYLQHQGTVELALYMLDDYTQDNHHRLDALIEAMKTKNIEEAKLSVLALALNAQILSAQTLQSLCTEWTKLLSGSETSISLKKVNALLKNTRIVLNEIDEYAETI